MHRGRPLICCLLAALLALATGAGTATARTSGCCCDEGVCPLRGAMIKAGADCGMAGHSSCSFERRSEAPATGSHASEALQPATLAAAAVLLPPAPAAPFAGSGLPVPDSPPHRPEAPPPRSS